MTQFDLFGRLEINTGGFVAFGWWESRFAAWIASTNSWFVIVELLLGAKTGLFGSRFMYRIIQVYFMYITLFFWSALITGAQDYLPDQVLVLPVENAFPRDPAFPQRGYRITDTAFSYDGGIAVIVGWWYEGFIWNRNTDELIRFTHDDQASFLYADISRDGSRIVTVDSRDVICIWDSESGEQLLAIRQEDFEPGRSVYEIKFIAEDREIMTSYSSTFGSGLYFWDSFTGEFLRHIPDILVGRHSILSEDSRYIFDYGPVIFNIEKGYRSFGLGYPNLGYSVNREFTEVYGLVHDEFSWFYYSVWDARSGEVARQGPEPIRILFGGENVWSRDGRFIFAGGLANGNRSALFNAQTGRALRMFGPGPNVDQREFEVQEVRFLPDGQRVAVAGGRYILIYDLGDMITGILDPGMYEN